MNECKPLDVGHPYAFKGGRFYRVVHNFVLQTGSAGTESVYGGHFWDDPGGLEVPHNRPGLVSMVGRCRLTLSNPR